MIQGSIDVEWKRTLPYPHTKYEKFLISGCRVISNKKNFEIKLGYRMGRTEGWTDEGTNGMEENHIPFGYNKQKTKPSRKTLT